MSPPREGWRRLRDMQRVVVHEPAIAYAVHCLPLYDQLEPTLQLLQQDDWSEFDDGFSDISVGSGPPVHSLVVVAFVRCVLQGPAQPSYDRGDVARADIADRRSRTSAPTFEPRGNFRLIQRLFAQIDRVLTINSLATVTTDVVDAARESLVVSAL